MFTTAPIATQRWVGGKVPQLNREYIPPGLVFCAVPAGNAFVDLVSGLRSYPYTVGAEMQGGVVATTGTAAPGTQAFGFHSNGSSTVCARWGQQCTGLDFLTTTGTVLVLGSLLTSTGSKMHPTLCDYDEGAWQPQKQFMLYIDDNGTYGPGRIIAAIGASSSTPNVTGTVDNALTSDPKNKLHFFGVGWDAGATRIYYQGNKSNDYTTDAITAGVHRYTTIGSGDGTAHNGFVALGLAFNRKLSVEEYNRLWQNPYAVLR